MAMQYVRTDRNGTKIYHDHTCTRCGGLGRLDQWAQTGYTCYDCGGSGQLDKPAVIKVYTPEYRAKLDAQAAKRFEKKMAQARAEKADKQAEWKAGKGFVDDRIYPVGIRDSFERKDEIKAAGGRYNDYVGWYFSEPHPEFQTVELTADEILYEDAWCELGWVAAWKIRELIKAQLPDNSGKHLGQVGGKIELDATFKRARWFDTRFGTTWIYVFEDDAGNCLVWKTSASIGPKEGDRVHIKATVKDHDEYNDVKQTILTRCRID